MVNSKLQIVGRPSSLRMITSKTTKAVKTTIVQLKTLPVHSLMQSMKFRIFCTLLSPYEAGVIVS